MNGPVTIKDIAKVCSTCYESTASVRGECTHTKECYVVGESGRVERIRSKPTNKMILNVHSYTGHVFNGNYKLCWNYPQCTSKCTFAHGSLELQAWNGLLEVERRCPTCSERLKSLFQNQCLDSAHSKDCGTLLLYHNSSNNSFEAHRQLPRNRRKMKSKSNKFCFKHTEDECRYGGSCTFPHSKQEEEVWNLLLYSTQVTPCSELPEKADEVSLSKQIVPQATYQSDSCYGCSDGLVPMKYLSQQHLEGDLSQQHLEGDLSPQCYKDRFCSLLLMEENRRQLLLQRKCNGYYVLTVTHSRDDENRWIYTGFLQPCQSELHVQIIEYASEFGDKVQLTLPSQDMIMGTNINLYLEEDKYCLAIELPAEHVLGVLRYNSMLYEEWIVAASFDVKQSYEICRKRLRVLHPNVIVKLFPDKAKVMRPRRGAMYDSEGSQIVPDLDEECQMPALKAILRCPASAPFLLTGPFGTGKTRLIVRAAYEVLLAAPYTRVLISVHHKQTASTYIDDYFGEMSSRKPLRNAVARVVSTAKRIPSSKYFKLYCTYNDPYLQSGHCRVVITTCTVAGMLARVLPSGWFTHIFVDEAAQPVEPEAVMPLGLAGPETHIVLAGDHLQCGPQDTVYDPEAGRSGLYTSLLERLHTLYMSQGKGSALREEYIASLFTNYRCDAAILRLPSILLYDHSLLTRAADSSPHPQAPYPVMFVCSSLDKSQTSMSTSDIDEANLVIETANRYLSRWPECWSTFQVDQACILARTHQQQNVLRESIKQLKQARGQGHLRGSQVRVTFAIQGLEFRVVFLSTHEPREYEDSGKLLPCLDPGGTVANKRVFNTMITRAKSLFVAIGNPFYLLDAEESLVASGNQTAFCWREFLKTCIDHNSIVYPENCILDQRTELLERIYGEPSVGIKPNMKKDSILMKTKEDIRENIVKWLEQSGVSLYHGEWILGQFSFSLQSSSDADLRQRGNKRLATHILICTKVGEAKAEPLQRSGEEYRIVGSKNRRGALDEALVRVEKIQPPRKSKDASSEHDSKPRVPLGKVVQIIEQGPTDTFVCRVDRFNSNLMIPLSAKDPKLFNLPHISRVLMNVNKERQHRKGKNEPSPVVCFDKNSLTQDNPCIRDVIPFKDAKDMLFLVLFIRWGANFDFPLGAVIDVFPVGHSLFHAQRILKAQYHIVQRCDGPLDSVSHDDTVHVQTEADFPFAFTLDQPGSVTLDDALSLKRIDCDVDSETFEFAVHITSVASNERVSELLAIAREKGCTVYQPYKGRIKRYSMLPEQEAQSMSLDVGCVRECISIVGQAKIADNGSSVISISGESGTFTPQATKVKSEATLFYNVAEKVLDGEPHHSMVITEYNDLINSLDTNEYPPLTEQLVILQLISQHLKAVRLQSSPFFSNQCLPERQDRHSKDTPQASAVVQEFMIWAGWKVAEFLSDCPISYVPLRHQESPSAKEVEKITPQIQRALGPYHEHQATLPKDGIMFSLSVIKQLLSCMERGGESGYSDTKKILLAQQNHPQLTVALKKWYHIQRRAEYCIMEDEQKIDQYQHFSLNCVYTHFSSPLRRCFDILVQMEILNKLGERTFSLPASDARNLAQTCNGKIRKATYFERDAQQVEIAVKCFQSNLACSCYVEDQHGHYLTVAFSDPYLKDIDRNCCQISLDALKYSPQNIDEDPETDDSVTLVHATWKYKVCCLNSTPSVVKEYQLPAEYSEKSLTDNVSVVHTYSVETHVIDEKAEECFKRTSVLVAQPLPVLHLNASQWLRLRSIATQPRNAEKLPGCAKMLQEVKELAQDQSEQARDELYASSTGFSRPFNRVNARPSTGVDAPKTVSKVVVDEECMHEEDEADMESTSVESSSDEDSESASGSDQPLSKDISASSPSTEMEDRSDVRNFPLKKLLSHYSSPSGMTVLERINEDDEAVPESTSGEPTSDKDSKTASGSDHLLPKDASGLVSCLSTEMEDHSDVEKFQLKKPSNHKDIHSCETALESTSSDDHVAISSSDQTAAQSLSGPVAFQVFEVARSLSLADPLDVWLGASVRNRIISPSIHLVQPVPGLDLCVQHSQWPDECFSDPVLRNSSHPKYHDIYEYVDCWEPILLAEAAVNANKEHDLLFLKDVALQYNNDAFCQPCDALEEPHFVYKKDAEITLVLQPDFVEHSAFFFPFAVGNFVCARYEVQKTTGIDETFCGSNSTTRAVFHMVVKAVDEVEDASDSPLPAAPSAKLQQSKTACAVLTVPKDAVGPKQQKVTFKFVGERNSIFPRNLKEELEGGQQMCTMQLIPSPTPMRRMYRVLISLKGGFEEPALATFIACGNIIAANRAQNGPLCHLEGLDPNHVREILGRKKKQTDKSSRFQVEGGIPAAYGLWPKVDKKPRQLDEKHLMTEQLNADQWSAAKKAMSHKFTLIQGPPGTGKSITGAHLALAFVLYNELCCRPKDIPLSLPNGETFKAMRPVMYCAPSNKAVDRVLEILHDFVLLSMKFNMKCLERPVRILRLYSKAVERKSYPGPFADKKVFPHEDTDHKCPTEFHCYALHHIIRQNPSSKLIKLENRFKKMHSRGLTPAPKAVVEYRKLLYRAELHALMNKSYDIVMCTCNEAASHRVMGTIRPAQCIIDEAAMATEPETMIPINLSDHVVLIGDHKQLQPVIMCRGARENGLSISLFERYCTGVREEQFFTMLTIQYRMHESICEFPSNCFYDGKLTADQSVQEKYDDKFMTINPTLRHNFWQDINFPIMFCHVIGQEDSWKEKDGKVALQSKLNKKEAQHVMFIVKHLLINRGVKGRIAVLTFYKGQKRQLEKLWKELMGKFPQLKHLDKGADPEQSFRIGTINESQGDEFDIVLLSTVRSLPDDEYNESVADRRWLMEHLGFVTNQHQICVGITRAKFGLIIVGNSNLLRMDDTWNELIEHYEANRCFRYHSRWPVPLTGQDI